MVLPRATAAPFTVWKVTAPPPDWLKVTSPAAVWLSAATVTGPARALSMTIAPLIELVALIEAAAVVAVMPDPALRLNMPLAWLMVLPAAPLVIAPTPSAARPVKPASAISVIAPVPETLRLALMAISPPAWNTTLLFAFITRSLASVMVSTACRNSSPKPEISATSSVVVVPGASLKTTSGVPWAASPGAAWVVALMTMFSGSISTVPP